MINQDFFTSNRQRVCELLQDGVLVLGAYDKMQQANDSAAPFVQEANFWWLTGLELPGWQLLLDGKTGNAALVAPQLSVAEKIFETTYTSEQAQKISGISSIIHRDEMTERVRKKVAYALKPQTAKTLGCTPNPAMKNIWKTLRTYAKDVQDARPVLAKLRAIKQPVEIDAMKRAIDLTVDAFERIAPLIPTMKTEAEVAAEFSYDFIRSGATHAYEPIVAAGKNACTLHYSRNNAALNGLVLLDIGAKIDGYSADITRTYAHSPATDRQRAVHDAVREAQAEIVALLRPGLEVREYIASVDEIMKTALVSLGLMKNMIDTANYRHYFPHAISHGLGVDVHDSLGGARELQAGMVLTVEPGIYIPKEGIGVRIEDDVLITQSGHENLSGKLPTVL